MTIYRMTVLFRGEHLLTYCYASTFLEAAQRCVPTMEILSINKCPEGLRHQVVGERMDLDYHLNRVLCVAA